MNNQFVIFLNDFVKQYNTDVFKNISKCKSLLLDHAKGEYNKEIRLLLQVLELDCHKEIINSSDINFTRISLIKKIQNEYFITEDIASFYIDLLLSVLRDYKIDIVVEKKRKINSARKKISNTPLPQNISHDYEKEAKAGRFYQTAINCFFKDISNNFTLAIGSLLKAIKLCPHDIKYHYFISYCFYKEKDNKSLQNEIQILRDISFDKVIKDIISNDILSTKHGKIASRLYNAFQRGGDIQVECAKTTLFLNQRIRYSDSAKIFNKYMDFIKWSEDFDKTISIN